MVALETPVTSNPLFVGLGRAQPALPLSAIHVDDEKSFLMLEVGAASLMFGVHSATPSEVGQTLLALSACHRQASYPDIWSRALPPRKLTVRVQRFLDKASFQDRRCVRHTLY